MDTIIIPIQAAITWAVGVTVGEVATYCRYVLEFVVRVPWNVLEFH